jgi:hypothetical protein
VVGETDEIVSGLAVGGGYLFGLQEAVGSARVAVEVAAEKSAVTILE